MSKKQTFKEFSQSLETHQMLVHASHGFSPEIQSDARKRFKDIPNGSLIHGIGRYPRVLMVKVNDSEALPVLGSPQNYDAHKKAGDKPSERVAYKKSHLALVINLLRGVPVTEWVADSALNFYAMDNAHLDEVNSPAKTPVAAPKAKQSKKAKPASKATKKIGKRVVQALIDNPKPGKKKGGKTGKQAPIVPSAAVVHHAHQPTSATGAGVTPGPQDMSRD